MPVVPDFSVSPTQSLLAGPDVDLRQIDPSSTPGFEGGKEAGKARLAAGKEVLSELQEKLFAESRFGSDISVLLILQAMDTAGKGGIVRHVVGAVDPQGVQHHAFKAPTEEEKRHDFLWRVRRELPGPGMIGVFDRSHYEDVLIHRVRKLTEPEVIEERYGAIREFEAGLAGAGTRVVKVMLHLSKEEQKNRLTERLERKDKHWKYNPGDLAERALWDEYQQAYQIAIERTSTPDAPWFVVPADRKWYARIAVQQLLTDALAAMQLSWPKADFDVEAEKERLAAS
ncbi:polyphosphate:nucleotide phosphotransferase, PPK2 family [Arthrobacter subterraneus]|uniref:Polyphosphate:nucleotide phosphotransferase, PPK2 family n=1 Tax=Arthrobacter subterraneus TaxID=335973 RepID=A0A1G8C442_9MICC|nr:polyphosphate kinase 2 family protein [Arthrobacter subterraneus]SDH40296.1 polyphosphate:nucleotide phosphotransferase, PPK2 family [Arthrobacter subterraneus]